MTTWNDPPQTVWVLTLLLVTGCYLRDEHKGGGPTSFDGIVDSSVTGCTVEAIRASADVNSSSDGGQKVFCQVQPDGSLAMRYEDNSSAECTFSFGQQELLEFDSAKRIHGALEAQFCITGNTPGEVSLALDINGKRRRVRLATTSCDMGVASTSDATRCFRKYLVPGAPSAINSDLPSPTLSLVAEKGQAATIIRLFSLVYHSPDCACSASTACLNSKFPICRRFEPEGCMENSNQFVGSLCVDTATDNCNGLIGRFEDGWHTGESDALWNEFTHYSPAIGCPFDRGGGSVFAHRLGAGIDIQDFAQRDAALCLYGTELVDAGGDPSMAGLSCGVSALVVKRGLPSGEAFLMRGALLGAYLSPSLAGFGGPVLLGAPTSDMRWISESVQQTFEKGELWKQGNKVWACLYPQSDAAISPDWPGIDVCYGSPDNCDHACQAAQ